MTPRIGPVDHLPTEHVPGPRSLPSTRPAQRRLPGARGRSTWRVPVALVILSIIPVVAGSLRLLEIAGGQQLLPTNPRIDALPAPVVVHIVAATLYALLGAFQFSARLHHRRPGWHRISGRLLVVAGLVVAGSGLWMTLFYTGAPGGDLLWTVRLLVGSALAASIVLGVAAIRRRDITAHRAWMIRAYALAVGAGTQAFTQGIGEALFGAGELSTALSLSSGWFINVAIAEWIIRRPHRTRAIAASSRRSPVSGPTGTRCR